MITRPIIKLTATGYDDRSSQKKEKKNHLTQDIGKYDIMWVSDSATLVLGNYIVRCLAVIEELSIHLIMHITSRCF